MQNTIINFCASKKETLACVFSQNGNVKSPLGGHIDHLVVLFEDDTIEQQGVVEAGRRRVPRHPPLHNARDMNVAIQSFQKIVSCIAEENSEIRS